MQLNPSISMKRLMTEERALSKGDVRRKFSEGSFEKRENKEHALRR